MATGTEVKTILIIEDEPNIIKFASRVLELEGFHIIEARDADEGWAVIRQSHIDLILLDLMLPGTDGWEVLTQLKNDPHVSTVPVVVFTAAVELPNQERALSMGAVEFLMKPLSSTKLRETVHDTLHSEGKV
ncbi:two-component system response regulator [Chloroflexota bacterium]